MMKQVRKLILLELNEVNFDVVEKYVASDKERFPFLAKLLKRASIRTTSEKSYENIEPWIQWPSVHTAQSFSEHGIFRLGDIVGGGNPQIFELLEQAGYKVGVISAMNAENRLENPAYFIPDPWTKTHPDNSLWSRLLAESISQVVNDNAKEKITLKSALQIILSLFRFARIKNYIKYLHLLMDMRRKPWSKALFLDLLLHDVHWTLFNNKKPDFSTLFLNAGAHIQHHYFFNAKPLRNNLPLKNPDWYVKSFDDPVADVLSLYDSIVGEYFSRRDTEVVLATGLSQIPYDRLKYYYRLSAHSVFLKNLGIKFSAVYPRMTRDFLIEFEDKEMALMAQSILGNIKMDDNILLFGEIDNRGKSLFVTLTYPHEITDDSRCNHCGNIFLIKPLVSFVAIKNGMHQPEGFVYFTPGFETYAPDNFSKIGDLGKSIARFFSVNFLV